MSARLAGLPERVTVKPGRIEVRFSSAREAVGRLFALAQTLTNDYERFETVVGGQGHIGQRNSSLLTRSYDVSRRRKSRNWRANKILVNTATTMTMAAMI
jgi:hypothetical protein